MRENSAPLVNSAPTTPSSMKNPISLSQVLSGPSLPRGPSSPAFTVDLILPKLLEIKINFADADAIF